MNNIFFFNANNIKYKKIIVFFTFYLLLCLLYIFIKPTIIVASEQEYYNDLQTVVSADTSNIIEINLYDYTTNINDKYINNYNYPGFQQDGGTTREIKNVNTVSFNFGNNITTDLGTLITNVTTNNPGPINKVVNNANSPLSGVIKSRLGSDGYPSIKNGNNEISLKYLFSNNTYASKQNIQNINGLFQHNKITGEYTFDSRKNHAQWNANNNSFTLYKQVITSNFMMYPFGNFLPFNDIINETTKASTINRNYFTNIQKNSINKANNNSNATYKNAYNILGSRLNEFINMMDSTNNNNKNWDAGFVATQYFKAAKLNKTITTNSLSNIYSIDYDEATNFFFGLDMKMNFIQPKGGLTGNDGKQPMVFEFSGDDDVLVYIDNVLFLDLSGIHRHVGGTIDFVQGKVYYYNLDPNTGDTTTLAKTLSFEQILGSKNALNSKGTFSDYSTHSFKFYYMERGAGSGVMKMNFNFPLIEKNSITVTKDLDTNDTNLLGNPDFKFQILKANNSTKTDELFITEGTKYDILNTSEIKIDEGTVLDNGVFILKSGQTAVFKDIEANLGNYYVREILDSAWSNQYESVIVDGKSTTSINDVIIDNDTFTGYESNVTNISNGHTSFVYTNKVNPNKYGSLEITKNLVSYLKDDITKEFKIYVTLDGEPLPVGTNYLVNEKTTKQVIEPGIILIKANEIVKIDNIIEGSKFEVIEKVSIMIGYQVDYKLNNKDVESVTGYINNNSNKVIITNTEKGTDLKIPVYKKIENPDGEDHNYEFELVEVTDYTGDTLINDGTKSVSQISAIDANKSEFILQFPQSNYENNNTKKHYYKISEVINNNDINTKYDNSIYIIEVTINNTGETFTSAITKVWLNGEEITNKKIEFINQLLTHLTLTKELKNSKDKDSIFEFEIQIINNGNPITGEYNFSTNSLEMEKIIFDSSGKALIKLKDKETITIYGLPYGATYKITEVITDSYNVQYQINSRAIKTGNKVTLNLEKNNNIRFVNTNISNLSLAQTGQNKLIIILLSLLGLLFTLIGLICKRKKKYE